MYIEWRTRAVSFSLNSEGKPLDLYYERYSAFTSLQSVTELNYDQMFDGISSVAILGFPDYPNVGDSAIFIGLMSFLKSRNVEVRYISTDYWLDEGKLRRANADAWVLSGGGNFGGLYPLNDSLRLRALELANGRQLILQAPQSVHFPDDFYGLNLLKILSKESNFRMAVRDQHSMDLVGNHLDQLILAPDAAHVLGFIPPSAKPSSEVLFLLRGDAESKSTGPRRTKDIDWPRDKFRLGVGSAVRRWSPTLLPTQIVDKGQNINFWLRLATERLARGTELLSSTDTVVTDRLHGMLLALHMGRRVIAIDNSTGKLSAYLNTWLPSLPPNIKLVKSLADAEASLRNSD